MPKFYWLKSTYAAAIHNKDSQSAVILQRVYEKYICTGFSEDMKKSVNYFRGRIVQRQFANQVLQM